MSDTESADRDMYLMALAGRTPAEALPTRLRHRLIEELSGRGLSTTQIASWTKSTYGVVERILALHGEV